MKWCKKLDMEPHSEKVPFLRLLGHTWCNSIKFCKSWWTPQDRGPIFIDCEALVKQGDNALGSVRPSIRPFVCLLVCRVQQGAIRVITSAFDLIMVRGSWGPPACRPRGIPPHVD